MDINDNFDSNGLTIATLAELVAEVTADKKAIYGDDISVDPSTPDGQDINITAQTGIDMRELLEKINAGFDPDQAEGIVLDQRLAINGIERNGGSFTYTDIVLTTDRSLSLVGLDGDPLALNPTGIYTIKDDEGNRFFLFNSFSCTAAGVYNPTFRAAEMGAVLTIPNTITTPETVIAGVSSVNNPDAAISLGVDEESDFSLKNRRKISTAINAIGPVDSLEATLANLPDVTYARVYENDTHVTDINGQLPNSVWCIVQGGSDAAIGQAIYSKKGFGCLTIGSQSYTVTRPNGTTKTFYFDRPSNENLYIRFHLSGLAYDADYIKNSIVSNLFWQIGANADGSTVTNYLKSLNSAYVITEMQVSLNGTDWAETANVSGLAVQFLNSTARITLL